VRGDLQLLPLRLAEDGEVIVESPRPRHYVVVFMFDQKIKN
jgi:hypothetical protein